MRMFMAGLATGLCLIAAPALAAQKVSHFQDWAVSSYRQGGHRICYGFTQSMTGRRLVGQCGAAVIVVTHGPPRPDRVAVSPCHRYGSSQRALIVSVDKAGLGFHARGKFSYADHPQRVIAAFRSGWKATAPSPTGAAPEVFSLRGFAKAYDAMRRECVG